jgi:hypothetical protein
MTPSSVRAFFSPRPERERMEQFLPPPVTIRAGRNAAPGNTGFDPLWLEVVGRGRQALRLRSRLIASTYSKSSGSNERTAASRV